MSDRRARALILLCSEHAFKLQAITNANSKRYHSPINVLVFDEDREMNIRVVPMYDSDYSQGAFIIIAPNKKLLLVYCDVTMCTYVGQLARKSEQGVLSRSVAHMLWNGIINHIESRSPDSPANADGLYAFCAYCVWFHMKCEDLNRFPETVCIESIYKCGAFPRI